MTDRKFTADEDGYILDIPKIPIDEEYARACIIGKMFVTAILY